MSEKPKKTPMGANWKDTSYSPLYQLYRRAEHVARELDDRRRHGWVPTKKYIEEPYDISTQLKILDRSTKS